MGAEAGAAVSDLPTGCATCPHARMRFNNGNGATTCGKLHDRIVAYGHTLPIARPAGQCPLDTTSRALPPMCKCGGREAAPPHACPYATDINDNDNPNPEYCTCCEECRYQCAMDI